MKVFFAGAEGIETASILEKCGVNYTLFSVFQFICNANKKGVVLTKSKYDSGKKAVEYLQGNFKHVIMDSGLFTLMFGAHSGKRDEQFLEQWQDYIVDFVRHTGYNGTVVEVDCQKIFGVEMAWRLREKLKQQLPKNLIMNVTHHEDGTDGVRRIAEFSDYIAISVPELRKFKIKNLDEYIYAKCCFIKNIKPEIKIHLLGCTSVTTMQRCKNIAFSCDSTSWLAAAQYGRGEVLLGSGMYEKTSATTMAVHAKRIINADRNYININALNVSNLLMKYNKNAGCQQ